MQAYLFIRVKLNDQLSKDSALQTMSFRLLTQIKECLGKMPPVSCHEMQESPSNFPYTFL